MQTSSRYRWFDALLIVSAALFSFVAVAVVMLAPGKEQDGVAVVFAPWTSAADTIDRAVEPGGRFVRFGAFDFIAVIEPEHRDYAFRARANGAWLFANPSALAACLKPFTTKKS